MQQIAERFRSGRVGLDRWKRYNAWLHHEEAFVPEQQAAFSERVYAEFQDRFAALDTAASHRCPRT